jgi:hypothetical protein
MRKKAMLPSLGRRGDDTQLLHHAELVEEPPRLNDLSIDNSIYAYPGDSGRLAGRWDAGQFACVRSVRCPPRHDLISFSDLFINREVNVREGVTIAHDEQFTAFRAGRHPGQSARAMVDMVRGDNLIGYGQLALPKDFLEETTGDGFVRFC